MVKRILALLGFWLFLGPLAWADDDHHARFPRGATFTTLITTPLAIEGLTGDDRGNLYTTGRRGANDLQNCPVWRISVDNPERVEVGFVPAIGTTPCSPSGITFDAVGALYFADGSRVHTLVPDAVTKPVATVYATDVPGTNGLAFDRAGNLWTGDGTTGLGRVWRIPPHAGSVAGTEVFRVQPMVNTATAVVGGITFTGIGRDVRTVPTNNSQPLVANGIAFDHEGDMLIADTARGAIWKVEMNRDGSVRSPMNCDATFTPNTLCLNNILVAHPYLEGVDGIALDAAGNIWAAPNERNAIVVVRRKGDAVTEVFRNPPNAAGLRNSADPAVGNDHILETPTSPFLLGHKFCTANSDGNRRDNSPNTAGEIKPAGPDVGKVSCMDQRLHIPGMGLPL